MESNFQFPQKEVISKHFKLNKNGLRENYKYVFTFALENSQANKELPNSPSTSAGLSYTKL